tara:strand:+ start:112370 stop:114700 length:2331 start_codon:yes stop_codon:yes gene_type:complete
MIAFALALQFTNAQAIDGSKIKMHFPFDTDLVDASGQGVVLNPKTGATINTYRSGKIGDAALFDGKPYITSGSTFDAGASFTIALWVKFNSVNVPSGAGTPKIIHQEDAGPNTTNLAGRPLQLAGATRPVNTSFGETVMNSSTLPGEDEWTHIAVVMDKTAGTSKLYINGVLEVDGNVGGGITANKTNTGQLSFGVQKNNSVNGLLNGYMDDFLITTEVLSQNQIKSIMTLGVEESKTSDTNIWLGISDDFNTTTNWSKGTVPLVSDNIIIEGGLPNNATSNTAITAKNIIVNKNASLNVGNNAVTATATTVYGGGSFIAKSTVSGTFTYKVLTAVDNTALPIIAGTANPSIWTLMSSPVSGETYDNTWVLDNFIGTGVAANRAIGLYNNTTSTNGDWEYFQASETPENFNSGIGFSTRKKTVDYQSNNEEVYEFTGLYPDEDVTVNITQAAPTGNNWNLVGNPFPSYILISELITANGANITDSFETIYVWNPTTQLYSGLATTDYIAPGQGFFVNADNSNTNNFTFQESFQSHQTGVTFYRNNSTATKIKLRLTDATTIRETELTYDSTNNLDLDPGKDIGLFTGAESAFSLYTHLVSNDEGVAFERQALPDTNMETTIVPVGVKANTGDLLTFTAETQNLPDGLEVYLEDNSTNTFTRIDILNSAYTITLDEDLDGIGRFYLRTTVSSLSTGNNDLLSRINIYTPEKSKLIITGIDAGKVDLQLYDILGKRVFNTTYNSNGTKTITLPILSTSIYIVKLQTKNGILNKKIVLK